MHWGVLYMKLKKIAAAAFIGLGLSGNVLADDVDVSSQFEEKIRNICTKEMSSTIKQIDRLILNNVFSSEIGNKQKKDYIDGCVEIKKTKKSIIEKGFEGADKYHNAFNQKTDGPSLTERIAITATIWGARAKLGIDIDVGETAAYNAIYESVSFLSFGSVDEDDLSRVVLSNVSWGSQHVCEDENKIPPIPRTKDQNDFDLSDHPKYAVGDGNLVILNHHFEFVAESCNIKDEDKAKVVCISGKVNDLYHSDNSFNLEICVDRNVNLGNVLNGGLRSLSFEH